MLSDPFWFHRIPQVTRKTLHNEDRRLLRWCKDVGNWGIDLYESRIDERIFASMMIDLYMTQKERVEFLEHFESETTKRTFVNVERFRRAMMYS